jgi:hypothetical protein
VYNGYWAFEAAAIAKIFGLSDSVLCANEYYPVLVQPHVAESVDDCVMMFESRKALQDLLESEKNVTHKERELAKDKYGNVECSFGKTDEGYYCFTHRARSKFYDAIDKIPKKVVAFISSTS